MTRSIVATLATSVLIATAHAQCPLSFAPAVSYATAGNGLGLAVADLNNDGLQDVVVGYSSAGGQVSVFLNQGGGVLGARTDFPTGTNFGMNSIESADLNADGFRDLVCGIFGGGVRILFNNGSGGFGAAVVYGGTASVRQVAIGDIDGNGTPDVVAADSSGASKVLSFLNSAGTGVLTSPPALNLPGRPTSMASLSSTTITTRALTFSSPRAQVECTAPRAMAMALFRHPALPSEVWAAPSSGSRT